MHPKVDVSFTGLSRSELNRYQNLISRKFNIASLLWRRLFICHLGGCKKKFNRNNFEFKMNNYVFLKPLTCKINAEFQRAINSYIYSAITSAE